MADILIVEDDGIIAMNTMSQLMIPSGQDVPAGDYSDSLIMTITP